MRRGPYEKTGLSAIEMMFAREDEAGGFFFTEGCIRDVEAIIDIEGSHDWRNLNAKRPNRSR